MRTMNLLPAWVVEKRRRRRLLIRLTAIEAVIFFLCVLSVYAANTTVRHIWQRSAALDTLLKDSRYEEADRIADEVKAAALLLETRLSMGAALPEEHFDYTYLNCISVNIPLGVTILVIEMTETHATLTAETHDLRLIERHRTWLTGDNGFASARLGPVRLTDDGAYRYVLELNTE